MDDIYLKIPPERIPWNIESPPDVLVELVESGTIAPCKAVDLGCGSGNYAVYLAGRGFQVTGVDLSPHAIEMARENAMEKGVQCTFLVADVLGDLSGTEGPFFFAYDWELLHHIFPQDRERYMENVERLLAPGSMYLSVCFHEDDPQFGGVGKYRKTPIGTTLYFSSLLELRDLFSPRFSIVDARTIRIPGKSGYHVANYFFMKKE
ncbi:MAG: class I SAM-dependent methyltransferase [Methanolinea sp.]|nr:class I SAM-dependent methyltransferase [Methanolinea sp.]